MIDLSRNSKSIASVTNGLVSYMKHSFGKFNTAAEDSIEKSFFWSLYHNLDSPSMIHFQPILNSRLSIHDKPFDCKVVGFFTLVFVRNAQLMFSIILHLHLQTHFSRLLRTIVLWSRSQSRVFLVVQQFCIQKIIDFVPYLRVLIVWSFRKMLWLFCLEIQTHFPP